MKNCSIRHLFFVLFLPFLFGSWGFFAHETIHEKAVYTLPRSMWPLYKTHIELIKNQATAADKRRNFSKHEGAKHYIDLDGFGLDPWSVFPARWDSAVATLSKDTLYAYGTLPWNIQWVYYDLVEAFDSGDGEKIIKLSGDLGHYLSDATVPLHTTVNYNGQLTGQKGIHSFWESRLPELFHTNYALFTGKAEYVHDREAYVWKLIRESFEAKDSVLEMEAKLRREFPKNQQWAVEDKNGRGVRVQSQAFSTAYHEALNGMVERRMRKAIQAVGDFWYTAWVDAGQPNLSKIDLGELAPEGKFFGQDVLERIWGN